MLFMTVLFVIILMILGIWLAADYSNDKANKAELVGAILMIVIALVLGGIWLIFNQKLRFLIFSEEKRVFQAKKSPW